jgi:hypothetical protein
MEVAPKTRRKRTAAAAPSIAKSAFASDEKDPYAALALARIDLFGFRGAADGDTAVAERDRREAGPG